MGAVTGSHKQATDKTCRVQCKRMQQEQRQAGAGAAAAAAAAKTAAAAASLYQGTDALEREVGGSVTQDAADERCTDGQPLRRILDSTGPLAQQRRGGNQLPRCVEPSDHIRAAFERERHEGARDCADESDGKCVTARKKRAGGESGR